MFTSLSIVKMKTEKAKEESKDAQELTTLGIDSIPNPGSITSRVRWVKPDSSYVTPGSSLVDFLQLYYLQDNDIFWKKKHN